MWHHVYEGNFNTFCSSLSPNEYEEQKRQTFHLYTRYDAVSRISFHVKLFVKWFAMSMVICKQSTRGTFRIIRLFREAVVCSCWYFKCLKGANIIIWFSRNYILISIKLFFNSRNHLPMTIYWVKPKPKGCTNLEQFDIEIALKTMLLRSNG